MTTARSTPTSSLALPDEATLASLASAFFSALPGAGGRPAVEALPTGPASSPPATLRAASPTLVPASAAEPPEPPQVPAPPGAGGSGFAGPTDPHAVPLPDLSRTLAAPRFPAPATSFYFLDESSLRPAGPPASAGEDRITARSFGLPGEDSLRALAVSVPHDDRARQAPTGPASHFYFLEAVPVVAPSAHPPFDVQAIRRDFPILAERVNGRPLIWFDNAATTQKPQVVIDRLAHFYAHENSNIHRAAHELAARATDAYEAARDTVARFLGASSSEEIVFVRGTTEAINLVAQTWGRQHLGAGDEIVLSHLEHHANIVPWQQVASEKGARIRVIPVDDSGQILLEEYRKLLSDRTKIVAITQVANATGTITPVREVIEAAHAAGAKVLVDGAQAVSHMRVDVQALDADFYVFSGHKVFGPTGIGVVYAKKALLEAMPPYQGGGNMIVDVTFERTVFQPPPARFEAGTGNIADAVGLGAALDYLERVGLENVARYEHDLLAYATQGLHTIPGLRLIGTAREKASVLSFVLDGYAPEEVGQALNREGIAVRAGHHCAQPILRRFGLEATVRPSLAFYNTCEEVDALVKALLRLTAHRRT